MKKIMFNNTYLLTQAVLTGGKTMTRRIVSPSIINSYDAWYEKFLYKRTGEEPYQTLEEYIINTSKYKVGEVVAIAQNYLDAGNPQFDKFGHDVAGNTNKMFVKADLMPHHIKINNVKVERLQDISDEDILRDGVWQFYDNEKVFHICKNTRETTSTICFLSAREAFEYLIDKVSGKGTWESNPLVVAYSFILLD